MMGKKIKTSRQIREKDDKIQDFSKGMKFENKKWVALDVEIKELEEMREEIRKEVSFCDETEGDRCMEFITKHIKAFKED